MVEAKVSPLGHQVGEVCIAPKPKANGERAGFVWEGTAYRPATTQEIVEAEQAKIHPLVNHIRQLSRRELTTQGSI